eukprot:2654151-Rhodomonas_salina.2
MVHPESPLVTGVQTMSLILLAYTAAVVPVIIGFKWDEIGGCWRNPLLEVDLFVDSFFLMEVNANALVIMPCSGLTQRVVDCDELLHRGVRARDLQGRVGAGRQA